MKRTITFLALSFLVVACGYGSPAQMGATGVTVTANGQLVMVTSWCAGSAPDGVQVYRYDTAGELQDQADIKAPSLTGGSASLNLEEIPAGWSLREGNLKFEDGVKYRVAAYSSKTNAMFRSVDFTTKVKKDVPLDRILIQDYLPDRDKNVLLTDGEFKARARLYC
ncbi:hypothetical protein ACGFNP_28680 [Nonomuraea sp. NPDC049269]|uniref:hypothetical protein n=1 Tax=Nonomuraea sp. NPDC049269 TaxID=3364349 RepID=UPI003722EB2E